ncbi:MAG: type II toxin-antitoxin system RelE/ParE family toxin [Planctomycetes bacterium]|nr:type II toxin-antitoxin system RelE/ParE family toxin [Planctomycetota bacterium]
MQTAVHARVHERVQQLAALENPLRHKDVRVLEGKLRGFYRLRVGEYRVVFEMESSEARISVLFVEPRGKAY